MPKNNADNSFQYIDPCSLYPNLAEMELRLPAYAAHRASKLAVGRKLIEEIDSAPETSPRPKPAEKSSRFVFRSLSPLPSVCISPPPIKFSYF